MKSEKEIIEKIIAGLKSQPEREYRAGAWENFRNHYPAPVSKTRQLARWASVAAALLLLGIGGVYYIQNATSPTTSTVTTIVSVDNPNEKEILSNGFEVGSRLTNQNSPMESNDAYRTNRETILTEGNLLSSQTQSSGRLPDLLVSAEVFRNVDLQIDIPTEQLIKQTTDIRRYSSVSLKPQAATITPEQLILASKAIPTSNITIREVEPINQSKNMRFGNKFDLSLFVSPHATGDKMNVGGGLTLAYNITNKISIRTGASYNSYEVGMLKNPTESSSSESIVVTNNADAAKNMISAAAPAQRMILPNINAVTSIVQSVDVPVELKYNLGKSVYAVAGASYSAIISQQRNAHYVDNINTETFSDGLPENEKQMHTAVKAVTKTVKSAEENVNTNGFNGFINFSIGKKVKINSRLGVSVEPYLKIPVGEYRRADMDYTNGGIRLMTNF